MQIHSPDGIARDVCVCPVNRNVKDAQSVRRFGQNFPSRFLQMVAADAKAVSTISAERVVLDISAIPYLKRSD